MKFVKFSVLLLLFLISPFGIGIEYIEHREMPTWNFIVLMCADNNLADYLYHLQDINEMEVVGSTSSIQIFVILDLKEDNDSVVYRIEKDYAGKDATIRSPIVENAGEIDFSDPRSINMVLSSIIRKYPSKFLVLVFWGHGAFYRGIFDDKGKLLHIDRIKEALSGIKPNVIIFDACRMGSVETLYAVRDLCDYMVASENDFVGDGLPYDIVLKELNDVKQISSREVAKIIIEGFSEWTKNNRLPKSVVLSAYNVTKFNSDFFLLKNYISLLNSSLPLMSDKFKTVFKETESYEGTTNGDFLDFIINLENVGDIRLNIASRHMKSIATSWIEFLFKYEYSTDVARANGLAIYIPKGVVDPYYRITSFGRDSGWYFFVRNVYSTTEISYPLEAALIVDNLKINISILTPTYDFYEIYVSNKEEKKIVTNLTIVHINLSDYGRYKIDIYGFVDGALYGHWYEYVDVTYTIWVNVSIIVYGVVPEEVFLEAKEKTYIPTKISNVFVFELRAPLEIDVGESVKIFFKYCGCLYEYKIYIDKISNSIKIVEIREGVYLALLSLLNFIVLSVVVFCIARNRTKNDNNRGIV